MNVAKDSPHSTESRPEQPALSAGMAVLLRRTDEAPKESEQAPPSKTQESDRKVKRVLRLVLFLGDFLLLAMTAQMMYSSPGPLGAGQILVCLVALLVGAWMACMALWL